MPLLRQPVLSYPSRLPAYCNHLKTLVKKSLPVKVQSDSFSFDIAESEYDTLSHRPVMLRERERG